MAKGVNSSLSKDSKFPDYGNCVFDSINTPITKEPVSFKTINHVICTITNNKIVLCNLNNIDILDKDGIKKILSDQIYHS